VQIAPGGTNSYTFTLRRSGVADSTAACTITGAATSCSFSGSVTTQMGDSLAWKVARSGGTGTVGYLLWNIAYS
jgi:hypothetical protein